MKIESEKLADHILRITLDGRLDIDGVKVADDRFAFLATTEKASIIVDLSAVSFLASIGIRMLMTAARGQQGRGGRLVLAQAQPAVKKVLIMAGIDQLIPLYDTLAAAQESFTTA